MTGLQMNVGLISGINYVDLVDQLIKIDKIPMDNLSARTERLNREKGALSDLMSKFLRSSYMIRNLNNAARFKATEVFSSNNNLVSVVKTGSPAIGSYTFTPIQMASSQQTIAKGVVSDTHALGKTGTITIGKGSTVESDVQLSDINGGNGFTKGSIRIIDADGNRATIDLRKATTVKDVINAINDNGSADVIAEIDGDHIVLRDVSCGTGTMQVQEVSGGKAAASLGIVGFADTSGVINGTNIWRLGENMSLSLLNDGNGIVFDKVLNDFTIYCRDGSSVNIDFAKTTTATQQAAGAPPNRTELTVGDLLKTINDDGKGKITARISDNGKGITLEDHTTGGEMTRLVAGASLNPILRMLGLAEGVQALVDPLTGLGFPPYMQVTDKAGHTAVIEPQYGNLTYASSGHGGLGVIAQTLNEALEGTGVELEFILNSDGNGLNVIDRSGGAGVVKIADYGNSDLASRLKLTGAVESYVVPAFAGVNPGKMRFQDMAGNIANIEVTKTELQSVRTAQNLADMINAKLAVAVGANPFNIVVGVNSDLTALTLHDTTTGVTGSQTRVMDVTGGLAASLHLATDSDKQAADLAALFAGLTPGSGGADYEIEFTDKSGAVATISFDQSEIDGITSLNDLVGLFNTKLRDEAGLGMSAIINTARNGIRFNNDLSGSTIASMEIHDVNGGNLAALLGVDGVTEDFGWNITHTGIRPGEIKFTDRNGIAATIEIEQSDIDAISSLDDIVTMFNDKLTATGTGIGVVVSLNPEGTKLVIQDTSGGTENLKITPVPSDAGDFYSGTNALTILLGTYDVSTPSTSCTSSSPLIYHRVEGDALVDNVLEGVKIEDTLVTQGGVCSGIIESRDLLGGLDTVLMSSLNGGFGLYNPMGANVKPGFIEVQDRAGHTADIQITSADLKSMQTLSDSVKIFNKKLADAGVGIKLQINESKTGLDVVDTTGSTTYNLIFKDKQATYIVHGTPAIPGNNAVSANSSGKTAKSGGIGDAYLEFENTSMLNGFSFAFTTNPVGAGYNSFTKTFTFDISTAMSDQDVKDAIDGLIASEWSGIYPASTLPPPEVSLRAGLLSDASSDADLPGYTTRIDGTNGVLGSAAGTAVLTFENTHWMNNFTFAFTAEESEAGYSSGGGGKFTIYLDPAAMTETNPGEQDRLVKEAVDRQISNAWPLLSLYWGTQDPAPTAKLTAGMGASAIHDAETGGETAIKAAVAGSILGANPVAEVPDIEVPGDPKIALAFGLDVNKASSKVSGANLNRQVVSHNTLLADWNNGKGVIMEGGRIVITDSKMINQTQKDGTVKQVPNSFTIFIDPATHKTVGDLLDSINRLNGLDVRAVINSNGDGIDFIEYGKGTGMFSIEDASGSQFAKSMRIAGAVTAAKADAGGNRYITVSEKYRIEVEEKDSLDSIRKKINDLNAGYSASIVNDGTSSPYRLSISSTQTGKAGAFTVDLTALGLSTINMSEAKDAKIAYGDYNSDNALILNSSTNTFKGIVEGMDLTITGVSDSPVTVSCERSSLDVKVSLQMFVENYNTFREFLNNMTLFAVSESKGVMLPEDGGYLWNSSVAKALDREVSSMLLKMVSGIPGVSSLADLGITMRKNYDDFEKGGAGINLETGKLTFDEDKFQAAWDKNSEAVEKFFFNERTYTTDKGEEITISTGWAKMFTDMTDTFCGRAENLGKIQARVDALSMSIDRNEEKLVRMQDRIDWKQQYYLKQFYAMENAMAKMTKDANAIAGIASNWQANSGSA